MARQAGTSTTRRLRSPRTHCYLALDEDWPQLETATRPLFILHSEDSQGGRRFCRVIPGDPVGLAPALAARIRGAYFDQRAAEQRLREAAAELTIFDSSALIVTEPEIQSALEDELRAVLPAEWSGGRPKQTDTQRSELAEIIAATVMDEVFGTIVPASRIGHKEIPDQQTRGVDVIGLEGIEGAVSTMVIAEVKGSCEAKSPPAVVDGMAKKLVSVTTDRRQLTQELIWLRDNCKDEYAEVCARICARYLLRRSTPEIVLAPILLRTANTERPADHGKFAENSANFDYPVRFISVIVNAEDLFDFAVAVYREARRLAGS